MRRALPALLALAVVVGVWSVAIEPGLLKVRRLTIAAGHWPRPPLKVALVSDIHAGAPHIDLAYVDELVARINAEKPDIILLAGDFLAY